MDNKELIKSINKFVKGFETTGLPGAGRHKESFDKRTELSNLLKPHERSEHTLNTHVNPFKSPPMGFGRKAPPEEHLVPYRVPYDKTKMFKFRGRKYDASRMTPQEIDKILGLME
jgi:hypothetical protein